MLVVESATHGEGVKTAEVQTWYHKVAIKLGPLIPL